MVIDAATRTILQKKFMEYANFEMRQRTFMEEEMKTRLSVKKANELPPNYKTTVLMENREQVAEDAHQCNYCTDFAYFSLIHCTRCKINYCIWHNVMCGCNVPSVQLVYRFATEELQRFRE